nr:hypothetical protein [uncultured Desulfobacter sp.]
MLRKKKIYGGVILALILGLVGFRCLSAISLPGVEAKAHLDKNVYVAFGFHGNLYHSFRGDTNDEKGYGKDIRIIRSILSTLDKYNHQGVPVHASWEFDNHFSLERLLPENAPDIIDAVRRRVTEKRDEVLLMSYNNGLASAMTNQEFTDSVNWSISNPWGSGVKDLFGSYSPIVRPQEMMTTPGNFKIYKQAGIKAVSLYYSATPFDTFRVFSRKLTREEAHNPLTYKNDQTGEEILVIPTYNIGDLVENVSLAHWVNDLHLMQISGKISRDVLVYINFDADSDYWTGTKRLKWPLNQLPNTGGLEGLIEEVKDLHFVKFTTVNDYLAHHGPAGEITFSQDTADGSFDGYNSWSEKWRTTTHWTRIVSARNIHNIAEKIIRLLNDDLLEIQVRPLLDKAYILRMKALSTTNFGMASPDVAPQRRQVMEDILNRLDHLGIQIETCLNKAVSKQLSHVPVTAGYKTVGTLMLAGPQKESLNRFVILKKHMAAGEHNNRLYLNSRNGTVYPLIPVPGIDTAAQRFYISGDHPAPDGIYVLTSGPGSKNRPKTLNVGSSPSGTVLQNKFISMGFNGDGILSDIRWNHKSMIEQGSLLSYIRYEDKRCAPENLSAGVTMQDQTAAVRMTGDWQIPDRGLYRGSVNYTFSLLEDLPYLFVQAQIKYPATVNTSLFKADLEPLGFHVDPGWQEVAPLELRLHSSATKDAPVRILKHNYLDVDSSYDLDYYRHSEKNLDLDDVNNHITAGFVGIAAGHRGVALSMDQTIAANFAGMPVKVKYNKEDEKFKAGINPFGTYYGKQNRRPTWGNGQGHKAALLSGEQYHSAAPTYNGQENQFALMIGFFDGDRIPEQMRGMLKAHANPARVYGTDISPGGDLTTDQVLSPAPVDYSVSLDRNRVIFSWNSKNAEPAGYILHIGSRSGHYTHHFKTAGNQLTLDGLSYNQPFKVGQHYYAMIESVFPDPGMTVKTQEFTLNILPSTRTTAQAKMPWPFMLKIIWVNLATFFDV